MEPRDPIPSYISMQEQLAPAQARRRRERMARILIGSVFGTLILLLAGLFLVSRIDPNRFRGRIEAAVQQATGRDFKIRGLIRIISWRNMTITADDVILANAPWGSRPEMLTLGRIEADVALTPLFQGLLRLPRLALYDADLVLERDANGLGNWQFAHAASLAQARAQANPAQAEEAKRAGEAPFAVRTVHLRDLKVSWREAPGADPREFLLRRVTTSENLREGNVGVGADISWRGQPINITGSTGSLIRLMDPAPPAEGDPPWGLLLTATVPGAKATLAGTIQRPLELRGVSLRLDAVAPDLNGIAAVLGISLPPLRAMTLAGHIADKAGDGNIAVQSLAFQAGASDLGALVPGLRLERGMLSARNPDDAIQAELRGTVSGTELRATASFGTLAQLLDSRQRRAAFPVELNANLGESTLVLRGLTAPLGGKDAPPSADMAVALTLRDLADFSAFAGRKLPTQRGITFEGRIATIAADASGPGEPPGIALRGAALRMPLADIDGDVDIILGPRTDVRTVLRGKRLDADGLIDAVSKINFGPPSTELPRGALPIRRTERPVIPDAPFDLTWMGAFDADISLGLDELTLGGLVARNATVRALLRDRQLSLAPVSGTLPGGPFTLTLTADARQPAMPVTLRVSAPALDVRPMLNAFGRTEDISGLLELDADLTGAGRSWYHLLAGMTGHLGLAMVDGQVDNKLMQPLLGGIMRAARVPSDMLFGPGRSRVRCFALRMDAQDGDASLAALTLDVGRALVQGSGTVRFRPEMFDLRLRPNLRVTATGITVPLKLTDRFRSPSLTVDEAAGAQEAVNALAALSGRALGLSQGREADACPPALALARKPAGATAAPAGRPMPAAPPPPNLFPDIKPVPNTGRGPTGQPSR